MNKKECDYIHMCPIVLKCRQQGIYTRKGTNKCVCRDYYKEQRELSLYE